LRPARPSGEHIGIAVEQCDGLPTTASPRSFRLGDLEPTVRMATEAVRPSQPMVQVENALKNEPVRQNDRCYRRSPSLAALARLSISTLNRRPKPHTVVAASGRTSALLISRCRRSGRSRPTEDQTTHAPSFERCRQARHGARPHSRWGLPEWRASRHMYHGAMFTWGPADRVPGRSTGSEPCDSARSSRR
jgi:hypothetical protein